MYGRYREVFGYLKHSWVNKSGGPRPPSSVGAPVKDGRDIWAEHKTQEMVNAVLNKELSLTAAAVR